MAISQQELNEKLDELAQTLKDADAILIGAGAGLSAADGLSLADREFFKKRYPYWAARGRRSEYDMFSFRDWTEEQMWAYHASEVHILHAEAPNLALYKTLLSVMEGRNHFVITSNVDEQFKRNGFPKERVFEYQGTHRFMRCSADCTDEVYDFLPFTEKMMAETNPETASIPKDLVPKCPRCGAELRFAFRDVPWHEEEALAYKKWLASTENQKLVLLEFGVGFNSAGIIRVPFERITGEREQAKLYRITVDYPNDDIEIAYPEIPKPIEDKAVSINADAKLVIEGLAERLV